MAEQRNQPDQDFSLLRYWLIGWRYRWMMVILCTIAVLTAMVLSLLSQPIFRSTVTILVPNDRGGGGMITTLLASGIAQRGGISIPSLSPDRDILISILRSRSLARKLVEAFKLKGYYNSDHIEGAISTLQGVTRIAVSREGVINITVEDTSPKQAADLANAYPDYLDQFMSHYDTGAAAREHRFIKIQLAKTGRELIDAEEAFRQFQEQNRTVSVKEQGKEAIKVAGRLRGEIIASEVQLQVVRKFATDANPRVIMLKHKISELTKQLAEMQYGGGLDLPGLSNDSSEDSKKEIFLSASKVPRVGLEITRLMRSVKVHETVFLLLTQQLEQAKIAEAKDTPVVQVLDKAVPARRKSLPRTRFNMALAGFISLFVGIIVIFIVEFWRDYKIRIPKNQPVTDIVNA